MNNNIMLSVCLVISIFMIHSLDNKQISKGGITNRKEESVKNEKMK